MDTASISPPPNAYNVTTNFTTTAGAKWGFGSEKRGSTAAATISPGPGNYKMGDGFNNSKTRFHYGQKLNDGQDKMRVPGAGAYNPDYKTITKSLPKYSMKQKIAPLSDKTGVPGPGAYESHLKHKKDAPRFGFGSSIRPKMGANNSPGPGHYKVNVKVAETAVYAIPGKSDEFKYV